MPWLTQDRERLRRFRDGDPEILGQVYEMYAVDVASQLARGFVFESQGRKQRFAGLRSAFDLDDVVQETFVRAFSDRARAAYDGLRPFAGYLLGIARNLVIDELRRQRRFTAVLAEIDETTPPNPVDPNSPELTVIDAQLRAIYTAFVESLDEADRMFVQLRFVEKRPRRVVEELTGLSPMQVRTREKKLRARLFSRLVDTGYANGALAAALVLALLGAP